MPANTKSSQPTIFSTTITAGQQKLTNTRLGIALGLFTGIVLGLVSGPTPGLLAFVVVTMFDRYLPRVRKRRPGQLMQENFNPAMVCFLSPPQPDAVIYDFDTERLNRRRRPFDHDRD